MTREEYLASDDVRGFLIWLAELDSFEHSYDRLRKGKTSKVDPWECTTLLEAKERYEWAYTYLDRSTDEKHSGSTFAESSEALTYFEKLLKESVSAGSDNCYRTCRMILDWGGVLTVNQERLGKMRSTLPAYLLATQNYFNSTIPQLQSKYYVTSDAGECLPIVMNAGFTKIYSLLCDQFVIYDGRVGAALGLLVRKYCEIHKLSAVPKNLHFRYGAARTKIINRNPSANSLRFRGLSTHAAHTRSNLKANWLLTEHLGSFDSPFASESHPLRSIEAALFMIGYNV